MAQVQLAVGGRSYRVACKDGGEGHLIELASAVDRKIAEVSRSMGGLDEARSLLFAALLLADDAAELRQTQERQPPPPAPSEAAMDVAALRALEHLAERAEALAAGLEQDAASA